MTGKVCARLYGRDNKKRRPQQLADRRGPVSELGDKRAAADYITRWSGLVLARALEPLRRSPCMRPVDALEQSFIVLTPDERSLQSLLLRRRRPRLGRSALILSRLLARSTKMMMTSYRVRPSRDRLCPPLCASSGHE